MRRIRNIVLRAGANLRAWLARRRLRASGVLSRVAEVQHAMATHAFKNVFAKDVERRARAGVPIQTANEIAHVARGLLESRWKMDTADVQLLVDWDGRKVLKLTAAPTIDAVHRAHRLKGAPVSG